MSSAIVPPDIFFALSSPLEVPVTCGIQLTLHRSLRSRRSQKPHPAYHKILKSLIGCLALFGHVICKARYPGRRVVVSVFEWRFEFWGAVILAGVSLYDVGFASPLLLVSRREGRGWAFEGLPLTGAEKGT